MKYINPDKDYVIIDLDATYLVPMSKVTEDQRIESPQEVKIYLDKRNDVVIKKDGYRTKWFYDYYFTYLRDTGYIKIK